MKYSWKSHKDKNSYKNRIKRSGQALLGYFTDIYHKIPTTWRWARGDSLSVKIFTSNSSVVSPLYDCRNGMLLKKFLTTVINKTVKINTSFPKCDLPLRRKSLIPDENERNRQKNIETERDRETNKQKLTQNFEYRIHMFYLISHRGWIHDCSTFILNIISIISCSNVTQ